jgi:DNA-binding Xre family transcriptional regulator
LKLRHNLDVMHIEKNICESILSTLMNIDGKTKDTIKARKNLQLMAICKELHVQPNSATYRMSLKK